MSTTKTDQELVREVLSGRTASYDVLVRRHQRFVFTLALRFTRSREDAEEVAQDSFVKAYRALANFRERAKFTTWLYSIVYTTSMTFLRKKQPESRPIDNESGLDETAGLFTEDRCLAQGKLRTVYINRALSLLAANDAAMITLFYQDEQSLEEIGQVLGIDPGAVKVRLFRARQRFRLKLEHLLKHEAAEL